MSSSHEQRPIGSRRSGKALPSAPPDAFPGSHFRLRSPSTTLAILAGALLLPSLFYPLARDQGVFAYVGTLILKGGWPYRDVWEVKPPGIYYTYAAIIGCSGRSMGGVRACDLIAAV